MRVGSVDFFGTAGIDLTALRSLLPLQPEDRVTEADFEKLKPQVNSAVVRVTGRPLTDFSVVCCNASGAIMIYIGLAGKNSRTLPHLLPPGGPVCLPVKAVDLYTHMLAALETAARNNDAAEDDSKGYALSHNPALRETQLAMRDYAQGHAALLQSALRKCQTAENRQAAAELLGYANQSKMQITSLVRASNDSDPVVRNNAIRALEVIASSGIKAPTLIPAHPFVAMLNSDKWEDRNKAGLLLTALTKARDPKLLAELRSEALDSLAEMARWHNPGHADPYRELLGRIAQLDDHRIAELIATGQVDTLIAAAQTNGTR